MAIALQRRMGKSEQRSLEELARSVRKGITLPLFMSLQHFETKVQKIARRYGGQETIYQEGSHRAILIGDHRIFWSPRQRGNGAVLSSGVFEDAIRNISESTGIPYDQLELYIKGSGKPYKSYKRKFEEKYGI